MFVKMSIMVNKNFKYIIITIFSYHFIIYYIFIFYISITITMLHCSIKISINFEISFHLIHLYFQSIYNLVIYNFNIIHISKYIISCEFEICFSKICKEFLIQII